MKPLTIIVFSILLFSCGEQTKQSSKKPLSGKEAYTKLCIACHGADGKKGFAGAKDLSESKLSIAEKIHIITNGKNSMSAYKNSLSTTEIEAVANYIEELKK